MKKILVVDNNPVILKLLENFLTKEGHEVVLAHDGLEALDIVKTFTPDVFLVDLVMPKISGDKLCRILRTQKGMKNAFIIILSAIAVEQQVDFTAFGANACIAKGPFKEVERHIRAIFQAIDDNDTAHLAKTILGTEQVYKRIATEELLSTKEHFETTLNHIAEGFIELTSDWKIVYSNPTASKILRLSEEQILSSYLPNYFQEEHRERLCTALTDLEGNVPVRLGEKTPFSINGTFLLVTMIKMMTESTPSIIVIMQDISARKRDETELNEYRINLENIIAHRTKEFAREHERLLQEIEEKRQLELAKLKLENDLRHTQKLEALGTMATGIAHDFNNILTAVIGFTELSLREVQGNEKICANLDQVIKAGRRAKDLIRGILTFSRQKELEFSPVRIQTILKEVLKLLRASTPADINITEDIDENCEAVMADATQIHQIVLNLYTNAVQAMKEGGTLSVSLKSCRHNPNDALQPQIILKNCVELRVTDTGQGIEDTIRDNIFDPYFTTKAPGEGTGMGLAVVHGIVTSHGGTISVRSKPGHGSQFTVQLPVAFIDATEELGENLALLSGTEHILIVDDEPAILLIMTQTLKKLGYQVTAADNGNVALDLYKEQKEEIDAVLTDVTMPGMSGLKLAQELLAISPDLPIILCSGKHVMAAMTEKHLNDLGVRILLQKPFTLATLSASIRKILN